VDLYSLDYNTPLKDVRKFAKYVGGGAANLSVGLARLGLKVSIISGVSNDELGDFVIEYLSHERVDTRGIVRIDDAKTGIVFAEVFPGKDSKFIFYRENAADLRITRETVDSANIENSKIIVTTGTGLSANPSREATLHAMKLASRSAKTAVFNLDWRPSLWNEVNRESRLEYYSKAIELSTIVVGNEAEYLAATGSENIEKAISDVKRAGKKILILTRGEKGSRAYLPDENVIEAGPYTVQVLKTLGAGDGNLAGILYGLLNSWDMHKALRFGSAVGAIVVTKHSCSDAMPTFAETMSFVEQHGGF
jgi:5-dehydro-2-deoxygluconokinase